MTILITGSTGTVGSALLTELGARNIPVHAMARRPTPSLDRPGVTTVIGDFDDPASLRRALAVSGADRVFLLTTSTERAEVQQAALVEAAGEAGVRHLVKLSQWAADPASPVRFLRSHAAGEQKIRDSGLAYTFLRPNLFMQGLLLFRDSIVRDRRFFGAAGEVPVSVVDVRDIAAVAADVLTTSGHEGASYDLTGPAALSHAELAAQLSAAVGHAIGYVDLPPEALLAALLGGGLPAWAAEGLVEDYAHYRRGEATFVSGDVERVTGQKARSFADFATAHAAAFR
jgi:uncharacterized protein YbjT (DUF2867 family)